MAIHIPVLLQETIDGLDPKRGETVLDATLGGGGHSVLLCKQIGNTGTFIGIDADEDAVARNSSRLTCNSCGSTLNALESRKKEGDPCPTCGGKLIRRVIDTEEKIRAERLPEYYKNTLPVIKYLRDLGILREVDGQGSIEEVAELVGGIVGAVGTGE